MRLAGRVWNRQFTADPSRQNVRDFGVARNGLRVAGPGVLPQRVFFALSSQYATVTAHVPEQLLAFHPTMTSS